MTIDQYLVTCSWLWIACIILSMILVTKSKNNRQYFFNSKRINRTSFIIAFGFLMLPSAMLFKLKEDLGSVFHIVFISCYWSAYPLYLWVSTSFTFNIAYIG